ncbi:MAG: hypothetical protein GY938_13380 [Ketobacter sp.]|nr:hypothetical protein [Ketobacter sp.]
MDREFAALQAHYESQLATWQADTAILHGDLIQELELLRLCNTRLESDLHEKNAQLEAQIEEQHSLRVELKAHEKALSERDSQYHAALGEGESLRQALVVEKQSQLAMARDHQSQLASLKEEQRQQRQELIEQHDKETARLQAQLGKERGEWKLARAELEEALHATREENATLKAELQERRGESSQQRQLLAERDQRIKDLKLQVQSAAGLTATIEQQARQIQHQEQEIARLREKTDTEATDRITKLLDRIGTLQQVRGNEES